jgi:hypothetical protein
MKIHLLLILVGLGFLTSCSPRYSYFTKDLYEKEKWSQDEMMRIQFYVSRDIVLSRSLNAGETSITAGKIILKNGQRTEQVLIKQGTPGVMVLMPKEDRFAISFEDNSNDHYLMFGPNPKNDDRFALLAQDWSRENGRVHYGGQLYTVESTSAYASLMVDLRRVGQSQYESRKVVGRTVKG